MQTETGVVDPVNVTGEYVLTGIANKGITVRSGARLVMTGITNGGITVDAGCGSTPHRGCERWGAERRVRSSDGDDQREAGQRERGDGGDRTWVVRRRREAIGGERP